MRYRVRIADSALQDAMEIYSHICADSRANADRWFERLLGAIDSLEHYPRRCRLAAESEDLLIEVRQFTLGQYRVLFSIEGREVRVFHIRHGMRRHPRPEELL